MMLWDVRTLQLKPSVGETSRLCLQAHVCACEQEKTGSGAISCVFAGGN